MSRLLVTSSSAASLINEEAAVTTTTTTTTATTTTSKSEQITLENTQATDSPIEATTITTPPTASIATTLATKTQEQKPSQIVQVSLSVQLFKPEKLYPTPSMADNLPFDVEFDLRLVGCELINTAGRLLKLPQTAMATGQVLFHRYFYIRSFVKCQMEIYAMAAIFLACKIEESPRRIRDVMNVFYHIKLVRAGKVIKPMPIDEVYAETKHQIIKAERKILKDLGFCVHVKHPHKIIFIYLQAMECSQLNLSQKAWNYMNDSFRTDIFLRYRPENIVCACIYLSANESQISLPQNPPWYTIFGANEETIKEICIRILHIYSHKTRPLDELEKIVNECRENLSGEKKRNKEATLTTSAATASPSEALLASEPTTKEETSKLASESSAAKSTTVEPISAALNSSAAKTHKTHSPNTTSMIAASHSSAYYMNHHHHHPHAYNYPPPNYPIPYPGPHPPPHPSMPRQAGYNQPYSYYHEQGYMHGEAYYDSYHNENYYQMNNLRRNKSTSNVRSTSQYKEEEYSMSRKRYSSRDKSADREYSNKISNQTNRYDYHKIKSKSSRSRSRSPWKKNKDKSKDRDSRKRSKSRSRSSESKHKKKKSSHSRSRKEENRESSNHRSSRQAKSRSRSSSRKRSSKSKHISKDNNSKETDDSSRYVSILS